MPEVVLFIQDLAVIMLSAGLFGWLARRVGVSPVMGYLLAGIIVGTPAFVFPYVTDETRIAVLAQIGLVFLMFSIGLGLRLRRLRQIGLAPLIGTVLTAFIVFNITRAGAMILGMGDTESLFFAAMLVVSSSAVIGKLLEEKGLLHERSGQLSLSVTLLEDIVAVVVLTLLASYVGAGAETDLGGVAAQVGILLGFVLLLLLIGLLFVPRFLGYFSKTASAELETIMMAGLLFGLAWLAVAAGYSVALGAFLLGVVVAESPRAAGVGRAFAGLRDVFVAIFFVTIGMSIDIFLLLTAWPLIIGGTLVAFVLRPLAAAFSLILAGEPPQTAIRAGIGLSPIGEFSFVIVALGTAAGVISEKFGVAAVGVAFVTAGMAPLMIGRAEGVAAALTRIRLPVLGRLYAVYREMMAVPPSRKRTAVLWKLLRARILQSGGEILLITAIIVFSRPVYHAITLEAGFADVPWQPIWTWLYAVGIGLLCLAPLVAVMRNVNAMSLLVADFLLPTNSPRRSLQPGVVLLLRVFAGLGIGLWFWNFLPVEGVRLWVLLGSGLLFFLILLLGWRRFIRWHSHVELTVGATMLETEAARRGRLHPDWSSVREDWGIQLEECRVAENFAFSGRNMAELNLRQRTGASIVGVERQGFMLSEAGSHTHLFPGDRVLLLGEKQQIARARAILTEADLREEQLGEDDFHEQILEAVRIPANSPFAGRTLLELQLPRRFSVQIVALKRGERSHRSIDAKTLLEGDTECLVLGTHEHILAFAEAASPR